MSTEKGYYIVTSTEDDSVIKKALEHEGITKWAYILHDKDVYNEPPFIGDKKDPAWHVVCITDKAYTNSEIAKWFGVADAKVRFLSDRLFISDSLKELTNEDDFSRHLERHLYNADEVHTNFDFREYISSIEKNRKWELMKRNFDPAMLLGMLVFSFIIACAVKLSATSNHPWVLAGVVAGIGILYLLLNFLAIIKGKKENRFISGIPFIGGIHLLIAGLLSPCKWLALACILDFTIWNFLSALFSGGSRKK